MDTLYQALEAVRRQIYGASENVEQDDALYTSEEGQVSSISLFSSIRICSELYSSILFHPIDPPFFPSFFVIHTGFDSICQISLFFLISRFILDHSFSVGLLYPRSFMTKMLMIRKKLLMTKLHLYAFLIFLPPFFSLVLSYFHSSDCLLL